MTFGRRKDYANDGATAVTGFNFEQPEQTAQPSAIDYRPIAELHTADNVKLRDQLTAVESELRQITQQRDEYRRLASSGRARKLEAELEEQRAIVTYLRNEIAHTCRRFTDVLL